MSKTDDHGTPTEHSEEHSGSPDSSLVMLVARARQRESRPGGIQSAGETDARGSALNDAAPFLARLPDRLVEDKFRPPESSEDISTHDDAPGDARERSGIVMTPRVTATTPRFRDDRSYGQRTTATTFIGWNPAG